MIQGRESRLRRQQVDIKSRPQHSRGPQKLCYIWSPGLYHQKKLGACQGLEAMQIKCLCQQQVNACATLGRGQLSGNGMQ